LKEELEVADKNKVIKNGSSDFTLHRLRVMNHANFRKLSEHRIHSFKGHQNQMEKLLNLWT
jgi:hypothetical protein